MTIVRLGSSRGHQVNVNVAVTRMTKAGNRNAVLLLEMRGEPKEIHDFAPWYGDVFIQFHEARIAQGVAKAPADLPDLLAGRVAVRSDDSG